MKYYIILIPHLCLKVAVLVSNCFRKWPASNVNDIVAMPRAIQYT